LVESTPGFQVAIVGKSFDQGEANDRPFSPEVIGDTLVVQATNHLQGVSVIDLYVREGSLKFTDGSGLDSIAQRTSLKSRIEELRLRIVEWKKDSKVRPQDVAAREKQLRDMQAKLSAIKEPSLPDKGSYFKYDLMEVRETLGEDKRVASRLEAYYQRVNDYNKKFFADKLPRSLEKGKAGYIGVQACTECHQEERDFWDKTQHAGAYETLSSEHKEFNLDCVSCHVTGYDRPGGSTVTHVNNLKDVQCEQCHGPGSLHVDSPLDPKLITRRPEQSMCASTCHHPPHVGADWSVEAAWPQILGKGHGLD